MKRVLIVLVLAAAARPASAAEPAAAPSGKTLYEENCSACHMTDGTGVAAQQPPLRLSRFAAGPPEALIRLLLEGSVSRTDKRPAWPNEMPTFEDLPDADIAAILTHVRSSFGNKASAVTAAQVAAVRAKR